MTVAAVVLAAGLSSRYPGGNKLLQDLCGQPVICRTVSNIVASQVDKTCVVLGHQAVLVREAIQDLPVSVCTNTDFHDGMGSSLAVGVRQAETECDGIMICLGDMALVSPQTIDRLIAEHNEASSIVVPVSSGRRGHPVVFGRDYVSSLMTLGGDRGANRILAEASDQITEVKVDSDEIFLDADTPEALDLLRQRLGC